jgi:hypothetical protein
VLAIYYAGPSDEYRQDVGSCNFYAGGYTENGQHYSTYWPNRAYVCPECGECWARVYHYFEFTYTPLPTAKWIVQIKRCELCGDGTLLLDSLDNADWDLLLRELNLLLTHYEKGSI